MFKYNVIADDEDKIKISVLDTDKGPCIVGIEFSEIIPNELYPWVSLLYDGEEWVFTKFRKALEKYVAGTQKQKHIKRLKEISHILTPTKALEILDMLDEAVKLKWYTPKDKI